jgi:hypothetical protein
VLAFGPKYEDMRYSFWSSAPTIQGSVQGSKGVQWQSRGWAIDLGTRAVAEGQGQEVGLYKYILNLDAAMGFLMAKYVPPPDFNPAGQGCAAWSGPCDILG